MPAPPEDQAASRPPRGRFRFSLPGILFLFVCASAGLTALVPEPHYYDPVVLSSYSPHPEWTSALLAFASVGAVVALLDQWRRIEATPETAFARLLRLSLACLLGLALIVTLLLRRGVLLIPENDEMPWFALSQIPDAAWYSLLVFSLVFLASRSRQTSYGAASWRAVAGYLVTCIVIACLVADTSFISYLVHVATAGVEASRPLAYQRPDVFPDHSSEGFVTYRLAVAALVVLLMSIGLLALAMRLRVRVWVRSLMGAMASAGLAFCAWYAAWYHTIEFPRVSPDSFSAFPAATLPDLLGALVLTILASVWLACRTWAVPGIHTIPIADQTSWLGRLPAGVAAFGAIGASVVWIVESIISDVYWWRNGFGFTLTRQGFLANLADVVGDYATSPTALLTVAMLVAAIDLARKVRRAHDVVLARADPQKVLLTAALYVLITLIAVPTLAAYGFCSWLGPWYQ